MTKKEREEHRELVSNGKAGEFMSCSFYIKNSKTHSRVMMTRYFRSNIPINYLEELISLNLSMPGFGSASTLDEYRVYEWNSIKINKYITREDIEKSNIDIYFLNDSESKAWNKKIKLLA